MLSTHPPDVSQAFFTCHMKKTHAPAAKAASPRIPLKSLKVFEAAARHLSFKKAADELCVTPAAVSHQLSQLESQLGVQLFVRVSQGIQLTHAARASLPKLQEGLACLRESVELMARKASYATLSVAASPSFATQWLLPRLHRFTLDHPGSDVHVTTRMGPFLGERGGRQSVRDARVWAAEADVVLMFNTGSYPELHIEELMALTITPICSPGWLQQHPLSSDPASWQDVRLLHDDRGTLYGVRSFWSLWLEAARLTAVDADTGAHFTHAILALGAAQEGIGIVATTPALVRRQLAEGQFVQPFPLEVPLPSGYHIICNDAAYRRDDVAAFRAWLHEEVRRDAALGVVVPDACPMP